MYWTHNVHVTASGTGSQIFIDYVTQKEFIHNSLESLAESNILTNFFHVTTQHPQYWAYISSPD